jgi:hypothetical protein
MTRSGGAKCCLSAMALAGVLSVAATPVHAGDEAPAGPAPERPGMMFNRWEEDWSVLADPRTPREPFDELKYIPLSPDDPKVYLSLGLTVRERFESNDAIAFGVGHIDSNQYLISRVEPHADLRLGANVQVFVQLQSDFAPGKKTLTPVDQERLGLEQAFVAITEPVGGGTLKVRVGRQQLAFDLQRFISVRDGPNIRQSYDAVWADYEHGPWRVTGFYALPVQNSDAQAFADFSSDHLSYGGLRIERHVFGTSRLSFAYARYSNDNGRFLTVRGKEKRDVLDVHFAGAARGFDWDAEAMTQTGRVAKDDVAAWGFGSIAGYRFRSLPLSPRVGLQVDAASGNSDPRGRRLETFNPLFPNGYYENLAGYTGFVNFIDVKPSVAIKPFPSISLSYGLASQWRETTQDAVYLQPNIPLAGTAGRPGRFTGFDHQLIGGWVVNKHVTLSLEADRFEVSDVIRRAGGHDSDYVGAEFKFGW